MKRLLLAAAALAMLGGAANAGPHAGGTLIVHTNPGLIASSDPTNYCGQSGLSICEGAINSLQGHDGTGPWSVWWVIAAFAPASSPSLAAVAFGIDYTPNTVIQYSGWCGDFHLETDGANGAWPAPLSGTAVTWNTAQTSLLVPVAYFAGYGYGTACENFRVVLHPTQGASFADSDTPANLDPVAGFGALGFNCPGATPCPTVVIPTGACCPPNFGACFVGTADECQAVGGAYQGDGSDCDPDPCPPPPPTGACCIAGTEICTITTAEHCVAPDAYQGDGTTCEPINPCVVIPTDETSWGSIKHTYR